MTSSSDRRLIPLTEQVWYLPHRELGDEPVLGYVRGDRHALLIDTGNSPAQLKLVCSELARLSLPLPSMAVLTHWHWDHAFGATAFPGVLIAGARTQQMLKRMRGWRWDDASMDARLKTGEEIPFCDENIRFVYPDRNAIHIRTADIVLTADTTLDLGGICCEIIPIGGPHEPDSLWIRTSDGVLFSGDADCPDYYRNNGAYDKSKLTAYLEAIRRCPFSQYISGHREPKTKEEIVLHLQEDLNTL